MNAETANKIIAEYMGGPYKGDSMYCSLDGETIIPDIEDQIKEHYLSLDTLVPVWEKLQLSPIMEMTSKYWEVCFWYSDLSYNHETSGETLQQAAAIATAKMIKELKQ